MQSRNKLPIIVGGTNYYIESLLWKVLVDTGVSSRTCNSPKTGSDCCGQQRWNVSRSRSAPPRQTVRRELPIGSRSWRNSTKPSCTRGWQRWTPKWPPCCTPTTGARYRGTGARLAASIALQIWRLCDTTRTVSNCWC